MQTSTGDARAYIRYGRLRFTIDGQDVALTVYADADSDAFFLPRAQCLDDRAVYYPPR